MVGWTPIKRVRALLIAFMFVVVVVATGSWLVHSLLIQVVLSNGSQQMQVLLSCMKFQEIMEVHIFRVKLFDFHAMCSSCFRYVCAYHICIDY